MPKSAYATSKTQNKNSKGVAAAKRNCRGTTNKGLVEVFSDNVQRQLFTSGLSARQVADEIRNLIA